MDATATAPPACAMSAAAATAPPHSEATSSTSSTATNRGAKRKQRPEECKDGNSKGKAKRPAAHGAPAAAPVRIPDDSATAPLRPHPTLSSFYPSRAVSSCPCMLRVDGGARLLVVGDGDLSYSVGLVRHLCSAAHRAHEGDQAEAHATFDNCVSEEAARTFYDATTADPSDPSQFVRSPATLQLTCTTYEGAEALQARYAESGANAALLRSWGIKVTHGIDARTLERYGNEELEPLATAAVAQAAASASSPPCSFHHILFHFPHVGGKSRIHLNRALLSDFLSSARGRLVRPGEAVACASPRPVEARGGCVHVSLLQGQGGTPCDPTHRPRYADHWQLQEAAARAGLLLAHVTSFHARLYPGYNNKGFRSRDEEFSCRRATPITHVLVPASETPRADPVPASTPAAPIHVRRYDCVATDCDRADCLAQLNGHELSAEMRQLLERRLCDRAGHPLQQARAIIEQTISTLWATPAPAGDGGAATAALREAESALRAQGLVRRPVYAQGTSPAPRVHPSFLQARQQSEASSPSDSCAAAAVASAAVGASVASLSSSMSTYLVLDDSPVESLQWNLEPSLAVSGDLEAQMPLPLAVQLRQTRISAGPGATVASAAASASSAPTTADLGLLVVPLMRSGVSVLHEQCIVQLFDSAASSIVVPASVETALLADLRAACRALLAALFGPTAEVDFRSVTAVAASDSPPPSATSPQSCSAHSHPTDLLLRGADGVWHAVARGGLLTHASSPAAPAPCGWSLRVCLDKISMLRHSIPDMRWLWSNDARFLDQFAPPSCLETTGENEGCEPTQQASSALIPTPTPTPPPRRFIPFALHPLVYIRDNSFWLNPKPQTQRETQDPSVTGQTAAAAPASSSSSSSSRPPLSSSSFERLYTRLLLRVIGSSRCVSVRVTDRFTHPTRGEAVRFRCIYTCVDAALAPEQVADLQRQLHEQIIAQTGVEIR